MREQLESERLKGAEARQLLENKFLKEAFDAAEKSILDQMDEVNLRDVDMHTRLIMARKTVASVRRYIERVIETGQMAELQLKEPNRVQQFFRR